MKKLTVLGSTGSIGTSTLDVVARHPDRYRVTALAANNNAEVMFSQCCQFMPDYAVLEDASAAEVLEKQVRNYSLPTQVLSGSEALTTVAQLDDVDTVMAAITGAAGLLPTLAAAQAGKKVLLANKESLVMSGQLLMDAVQQSGSILLPIDSEHNAIFQCLAGEDQGKTTPSKTGIEKILLTASGGPFLRHPIDQLNRVTPDQACAHPNWSMGRKISVDSATMMNKGLELIEACWLFNLGVEDIQIVIHPQSIVHSMVSYVDGSILAQMGQPDMRTPIAHALAWPERIESGVEPLDVFHLAEMTFEKPDLKRFPCLSLAYTAAEAENTLATILNAANEIAVSAFLEGKIAFTAIPNVVKQTMEEVQTETVGSLETVLEADREARHAAQFWVSRAAKGVVI